MTLPKEFWENDAVTPEEVEPRPSRVHPALRMYGVLRSVVLTLGAVLGIVCILAFAVSFLFGVRPLVVISGSMEPSIPVGSVVFTAQVPASEVKEGSIVTVDRPRNLGLVTHRLVTSVEQSPGTYEFTLKGDANSKEDPEPYKVITVGKYVWHIVGLGYLAAFLQSQSGLIIAAAIGLALLAVFMLDPVRFSARQEDDAADS